MSHASYCSFISQGISSLSPSDLLRLRGSFSDSLDKLTSLNLDPIRDHLIPFYSTTGRSALYQPQILRSFLLMVDSKVVSIKNWVRKLHSDSLLTFPIGCTTGSVKKMVDFFLSGRSLDKRFDKLLQEIFVLAAIVPSVELGLLPHDSFTAAGDGTCLPVPSSHYGMKDCKCHDNSIWGCKCDRRYSDPDARWGWDSSKEQWFYGHTIYLLSSYNKDYHVDLPLYFRFVGANRHDSVSGVVALAEFRELCPDLPIINIALDSAHDNYPTYHLCSEWKITPFIDLNPKNNATPENLYSCSTRYKSFPGYI